jgi:hypothetical protein
MKHKAIWFSFAIIAATSARLWAAEIPRASEKRREVKIIRTPDGGIQPQVAVGGDGVVHLIYFKGPDNAGDIYYVREGPRDAGFSKPIRVNSVSGSAIAIGSVRGAQIAVGRGGRVHVSWLGSDKAQPRGPGNSTPMLYARLNDGGTAFEPQKNVMQFAVGLDGGGSVAADKSGNVYVVWHGNPDKNGEVNRRVWVARSRDDGKTFEREVAANKDPTGACGCCGLRAFADDHGTLYILYRAAREAIHRDMYLLVSTNHGNTFKSDLVSEWELNACPMSTDFISQAGENALIAWQTEEQVYFATVASGGRKLSVAVPAPGQGSDRKHPAVIGNSRGEILFAWTEGTGWKRGGSLAWQVFDKEGRPTEIKGSVPGLPAWDLVAAFPDPRGGFNIIY